MAGFMDTLSAMLNGAPAPVAPQVGAGMTNYGAAPSAQATPGPVAQVLARLNPQVRQQAARFAPGGNGTGPLNVSTPLGGGDMATAIAGGVGNVHPGESGGAAFISGLSGALGARQGAMAQSAKLDNERQETLLKAITGLSSVDIANRQERLAEAQFAQKQKALSAIQDALGGGGASSPAPQGSDAPMGGGAPALPVPLGPGAAAAPAPPMAGGDPSAAPLPAAVTRIAQHNAVGGAPPAPDAAQNAVPTAPIGGAPAAPAPAASAPAKVALNPSSDPDHLDAQATRLERAGIAAMAFDPTTAAHLNQTAQQMRQSAQMIRTRGTATDIAGNTVPLPGFAESKASIAATEERAKKAIDVGYEPQVTPDGFKFRMPDGAAPGPVDTTPPAPPATPTIGNTPKAAVVDPKTASVQTSIPSAPAGGGYIIPRLPKGAVLVDNSDAAKEVMKADAGYADMDGKAPTVDAAIQRYQSAAQALKLFESGSGAERLNAGAALAQSYGFPEIAKKIQGGDPAALQWLQKEGVGLTLDTLKAAQPRFAQQEFTKVSQTGVPNPDNLPQANHQLISEGLGSLMRTRAFMRDWQTAQQNGWSSPSAFFNKWSDANPSDKFVQAAQRQIGTFKGMDLPSPDRWTAGATYVAPKNMNAAQTAALARRGVAPGQTFRFNGADSQQPIQPIDASQGFSAHLGQ